MTPAEQARNQAISLEAKKDALSQRQSGDWKVTFTIQEIDMDRRFTSARMGTRYAMVLVEIGDDELPVQQPAKENVKALPFVSPAKPSLAMEPEKAKRGVRPWQDISPPTQAGIRCDDPVFIAFLKEQRPDDWHEAQDAAECVRLICAVQSRSQLSDGAPRVIWHQLDTQFQAWKALEHA